MSLAMAISTQLQSVEYVLLLGSGRYIGRDWYEDKIAPVDGRTIEELAKAFAANDQVYAFRLFKRLESLVEINGRSVKVSSEAYDHSGTYYLGGIVLTREQVAADKELHYMLFNIDNVYHCSMIIKHRRSIGWEAFFPEKGDVIL